MDETCLVGDVGGTNTRFGIASLHNGNIRLTHLHKAPNAEHASFSAVLTAYLQQLSSTPKHACFALAGPVQDNHVQLTNHDWQANGNALAKQFRFSHVQLINDFTAMARSIPEMAAGSFQPLIKGKAISGAPVLVTGPGTGLGVATLLRTEENNWSVLQGEGGHSAYAPQTDIEIDILQILQKTHQYISNELVASGSGLSLLHQAFCVLFKRAYMQISPAAVFTQAAAGDEMFLALTKMRARCVLRAAGDIALANGARGGVILAGGVTQHLLPYFSRDDVAPSFARRSAQSQYLNDIPVSILTDGSAPLIGAAAIYFSQNLNQTT